MVQWRQECGRDSQEIRLTKDNSGEPCSYLEAKKVFKGIDVMKTELENNLAACRMN